MNDTLIDVSKLGVLVSYNATVFPATMGSAKATAAISETYNADEASVMGSIRKLRKADQGTVTKISGKARTYYYKVTREWSHGQRFCPLDEIAELQKNMAQWQSDFEDAVNALAKRYDEIQELARKSLRAELFAEIDWPSKREFRERYSFTFTVERLGSIESDPWLSGLDKAANEALNREIAKVRQERVQYGDAKLVERIAAAMQRIVDKCDPKGYRAGKDDVDEDRIGKDKIFRDTLTGNVRELCDLLPKLNISGNKVIADACKAMLEHIAPITSDIVRDDPEVKSRMRGKAKEVLDSLKAFKPIKV